MGSLGKVAGLIAVAVIAGAEPAFAQGTEQEREACTPDAWRLCGQFIPDADRITDCLRNAGPRLSPACYAVFYPPRVVPVRNRPARCRLHRLLRMTTTDGNPALRFALHLPGLNPHLTKSRLNAAPHLCEMSRGELQAPHGN